MHTEDHHPATIDRDLGPAAPLAARRGLSRRAVEIILAEGISIRAAAARVGVSHQAVLQAWRRIRGAEPLPVAERRRGLIEEANRMAHAGIPIEDAARDLGVDRRSLHEIARRRGIPLRSRARIALDDLRVRLDLAVGMVESGSTIGEAGQAHGVRYSTLAADLSRRGIRARRRGWGRLRDGRVGRALDRVRGGASVADATMREGCSPVPVYRARRRSSP